MATKKVVVRFTVLECECRADGKYWAKVGHTVDFGSGFQVSAIPEHWLREGDTLNLDLTVQFPEPPPDSS